MGSIQDIKEAFLDLSVAERERLIEELSASVHAPTREQEQYVPTERQRELGITADMVSKHPILKLAGRWTEEEGAEIQRIIKEGDWTDPDV